MKLIIAGSRNFDHRLRENYLLVSEAVLEAGYCSAYSQGWDEVDEAHRVTEVISGGAAGVDQSGIDWAVNGFCPWTVFQPNWNKHGRRAGILRNEDMGRYADALVAVWDGKSRGTQYMIEFMRGLGKPVYVKEATPHR